jgi:hypothetical protein
MICLAWPATAIVGVIILAVGFVFGYFIGALMSNSHEKYRSGDGE